ncbi:hypothetical protein JX266_014271 [Neoarthrinium moseri]|nr:hypothetical protein JX266_014271 [Neoarthrinium moseri]
MAEAIGLVSGVLTLTVFAFKSGIKLHSTIEGFRNQPRQVRELLTELAGLVSVLQKLSETGDLGLDIDLTALRLTLEQCRRSCDDVETELLAYCSQSRVDRASFRDWAKLKCSGGDGIEGFRQQLIGYKSTITVALSFANLRATATSTEAINACRDLIVTTTIDLEAHLEEIRQKLEALTQRTTGPDLDETVRQHMEEEQQSTEKGLEFCAKLSQAIEKIQFDFFGAKRGYPDTQSSDSASDFCSDVDAVLEKQVSNIENYAEGDDTIQFMVSTDGKPINGKNRGLGLRLKQAGGHFSEESLQQVSQDFKSISIHQTGMQEHGPRLSASMTGDDNMSSKPESSFGIRHGPGFTLAKHSI